MSRYGGLNNAERHAVTTIKRPGTHRGDVLPEVECAIGMTVTVDIANGARGTIEDTILHLDEPT
jgi:hypothetical protein